MKRLKTCFGDLCLQVTFKKRFDSFWEFFFMILKFNELAIELLEIWIFFLLPFLNTKSWQTNQFLPYSNQLTFRIWNISWLYQCKQSADFNNVNNQLTLTMLTNSWLWRLKIPKEFQKNFKKIPKEFQKNSN